MLFVSLFSVMVRSVQPRSSDLIFRKKLRPSNIKSRHVISMLCNITTLGTVKFINQQNLVVKSSAF